MLFFFALHQWSPTHIISGSSCTHVASDRCTNQQPSTSINYHQVSGSHAQIVHIQSWLEQNHLNPPFRLRKAETSFCYWTHAKMQGSSLMMLITLQYPWPSLWIFWSLMRPSCNLCRHPFPRSGFRQSGWAIFQWVTYFRLLRMKQLLKVGQASARPLGKPINPVQTLAEERSCERLPVAEMSTRCRRLLQTASQRSNKINRWATANSQPHNTGMCHLTTCEKVGALTWPTFSKILQAKWLKTMLDS